MDGLASHHLDSRCRGEHSQAAEQLLAVGAMPRSDSIDVTEIAAWTEVARTILNLHETITRE